jgi:hypothetical protein
MSGGARHYRAVEKEVQQKRQKGLYITNKQKYIAIGIIGLGVIVAFLDGFIAGNMYNSKTSKKNSKCCVFKKSK